MIARKCASCGHQMEVSEVARDQEITCPRCGQPMPSNAALDAKTVGGKPSAEGSTKDFSADLATPKDAD